MVIYVTFNIQQSLRYALHPTRSPITVEDHRISAAICNYMTSNLSNFKLENQFAVSGNRTCESLFFAMLALCFVYICSNFILGGHWSRDIGLFV